MKATELSFEEKCALMRERNAATTSILENLPLEQHCRVRDAAARLGTDKTRDIFRVEPGVVVISKGSSGRKRPCTTLLIPESVLQRVVRRMRRSILQRREKTSWEPCSRSATSPGRKMTTTKTK